MSESRDRRYLTFIRDSIGLIDDYVRDGGENAFKNQPLVQDAVLRRLETLAEATGRLSQDLKNRNPDIPWRAVAGSATSPRTPISSWPWTVSGRLSSAISRRS